MKGKTQKKYTVVIISGIVMVFCAFIHAVLREISHDEAYTYMYYAMNFKWADVPDLYQNAWANNHWLNTIGIKFVQDLFRIRWNEFLIRCPNLIAAICFAVTVCYLFKNKYINVISAILLLLNSYFAVWFSNARGYGIALMLVTLAFVFYYKWIGGECKSDKDLNIAILFWCIASYAITTVVFIFASFAVVILYKLIEEKRLLSYIKCNILFIVPILASQLIIVKYGLNVSAEGKPRPPSPGSFYAAMFVNLTDMYVDNRIIIKIFAILLILVLLAAVLVIRKNLLKLNFLNIYLMYLGMILGLKMVMNIDYPCSRLLVVSTPLLIFSLQEIYHLWKTKFDIKVPEMVKVVIVVLLLVMFIDSQKNLLDSYSWKNRDMVYSAAMNSEKISMQDETANNPMVRFYARQIENRYHVEVLTE